MKSLPTVDQNNFDNYLEVVRKLDPELWLIKVALSETNVNPMILPKIIRSLNNLILGTGFGRIQIFIQNGVLTQIKGEESVIVEERVVIE